MTTDQFWDFIHRSGQAATDCQEHADALRVLLAKLPPEEILAFGAELDARLAEAYRWDLWGVAYLVNGGCPDDGFEYFRLWLIAQGRDYFEAALREPERAGDRAVPGEAECEALLYSGTAAYEERTGAEEPTSARSRRLPPEPDGEPWEEDDLPRLFPDVAARFG